MGCLILAFYVHNMVFFALVFCLTYWLIDWFFFKEKRPAEDDPFQKWFEIITVLNYRFCIVSAIIGVSVFVYCLGFHFLCPPWMDSLIVVQLAYVVIFTIFWCILFFALFN